MPKCLVSHVRTFNHMRDFGLRECCGLYKLLSVHGVEFSGFASGAGAAGKQKWKDFHSEVMVKSDRVVDVLVAAGEIRAEERPGWLLWTDYGNDVQ